MQTSASCAIRIAATVALCIGVSGLGVTSALAAKDKPAEKTATNKAPASIVGTWFQEAPPAHFPIEAGTRPDQVVLTIPAELMKLPAQDYVLTRKSDTTWAFSAPDLPTVTFTLESANKATLNLRGKGKTAKGPWFVYQVMNLTRVP